MNWRKSSEYLKAKAIAFEPYRDSWGFRCALCGLIKPVTSFHILSVGGHPAIRCEPLNLLPVCMECHRKYEDSGRDAKEAMIEAILPGRVQALRRLERQVSKSVMRTTTLVGKRIL